MDFDVLREQMVKDQLIRRGIKDQRVLSAFRRVPRHKFITKQFLKESYADYPLPIGESQTISQPYMVALMSECLNLKGHEKVLEIGTGSGYQAAILAELCKEVYTIERIQKLANDAKTVLKKLGYFNVRIKVGDGTLGWQEFSPFDAIIITASAPQVPKTLVEQLRDSGRMVLPIGGAFSQILTLVTKIKGEIKTEEVCGCVFVPLVGKYGWKDNSA